MRTWLAGVLALALSGQVAAQDIQPAQVQLLSFVAPIHSDTDASLREAPVTVYLNVIDQSLVPAICELSPRLRDAFMETLHQHPIPITEDRKMEVTSVEPLLLVAANRALRQDVVEAVTLTPGAERLKSGSSRSRATALGCIKIQ